MSKKKNKKKKDRAKRKPFDYQANENELHEVQQAHQQTRRR